LFLEVKDVSVWFDTAQVLDQVSMEVNTSEMVSLVGPNGAGKSTLLRTISGLVKWEKDSFKGTKAGRITIEGSVKFDGEEINGLPAHMIARRGLILCPERGRPFAEMSVMDNLKSASCIIKDNKVVKESLKEIFRLFPRLEERKNQVAGTLSGGERTMLAVGRALMAQARLLMVDEPSTGLSPLVRNELFERLNEIHGKGLTILLVEQDVSYAFTVAKRNYVMSRGHIVGQGTGDELLADEMLRKTYLGL
jgi:branched-chain amino acid transport system ATP-binding protein